MRKKIIVAASSLILSIFVLGCSGVEYKRGWLFVPQEMPAADRAIEAARQAGKDKQCPVLFAEASGTRDNAYSVYSKCDSALAKQLAAESKEMADALCPPKIAVIQPPPPPPTMPPPPPKAAVMEKLSLHLHFQPGKATINKKDYAELDKAGSLLTKYPNAKVLVEGHTDNIGYENINHRLSHNRADAVKNYLVTNSGINQSNVTTVGYGESQPMHSNDTAWGRYWNRRVDILILKDH